MLWIHKKATCSCVKGAQSISHCPCALRREQMDGCRLQFAIFQPDSFEKDQLKGNAEGDTPPVPQSLTQGTTQGRIFFHKPFKVFRFQSCQHIQVHYLRQWHFMNPMQLPCKVWPFLSCNGEYWRFLHDVYEVCHSGSSLIMPSWIYLFPP